MLAGWSSLEPVARLVVATLVNGIWQGVLIAAAVWLILRVFPRANASTRYAAWSLALLAVMVVPILTTLPRVSSAAPVQTAAASDSHVLVPSNMRHARTLPVAPSPVAAHAASVSTQAVGLPQPAHFSVPGAPTVILFALWGLATLLILVRLGVALARLEKLKHDALPLGVEYRDAMHRWLGASKGSRDVRICVSDDIDVPVAVGLFDSMILLPRQLLDRLETQEIDQISLHELAHLRRADDWTNGIQRFAQALLFFNPAIAFIARQMDLEREVACDDWVLSLTGDVRPYAFCLTKMAEATSWPHRALAAPGVFITRKSISIRIERLLAVRRAIGLSLAPGASAAVLAAVLAIVFFVQLVTPSIAYTGNPVAAAVKASSKVVKVAHKAIPSAVVHRQPENMAIVPVKSTAVAAATALVPPVRKAVATHRLLPAMVLAGGMADCTGCDFHGSNLANHDFSHSTLLGADFHGADLRSANFKGAQLTGVNMHGANLSDASFVNADLEGCDLRGATVTGADFTGASLTGCSLDLGAMSASQTALMLRECMGCDFAHANLRGRDLRNLQLEGADLAHADLRGADLRGAQFTGVDLSYAKLDGAKLAGADLTGCELRGVDLRNVDLSHVSLTGTSMSGVIMK